MTQLKDKITVITGAASGIGRSLAYQLANENCTLVLADMDSDGLADLKQTLIKDQHISHERILTKTVDVGDEASVNDLAHDVKESFGHIHMLFNNAGVTLIDQVAHQKTQDMHWLMDINFWGVVYGSKAFLPLMQDVQEAHIINISSLFGLMSIPMQSAYCASKFAVRGFTESLCFELSDSHINVSCVHPGGIQTNIVNNSRVTVDGAKAHKTDMQERFKDLAGTSADMAAKTILKGVMRNKRRILIGNDAKLVDKIVRLFANSYERILPKSQLQAAVQHKK